jgi:hypothetical protein
LFDISIQSRSAGTEAVLLITPLGSVPAPDASAASEGLTRWRVTPLDRFTQRETLRAILLLRLLEPCRPGVTLWAEISINGTRIPADERGNRTAGGTIADCSEPLILIELLSVEPQES